jgi:hypothetical protein
LADDSVRADQEDWPWGDESDALIAAPDNHTIIMLGGTSFREFDEVDHKHRTRHDSELIGREIRP